MKRIILLFITVAILLCGCKKVANEVENTIPGDVTSEPILVETEPIADDQVNISEEQSPVYSQQPMVAISMPLNTEYITTGDVTVYYYTYQDIYLTVQDQQIADTIIIDYLNRVSRNHSVSEALAEEANNAYTGEENWIPHFFEAIYSPTRADLGVLSLFGQNVIYSGGTHPDRECTAANYNMVTGEVLTLGSILRNEDSIASLCQLVTEKLDEQKDTYSLFSDYPESVQQRFSREASYDEDWYFSADGLCFFFTPYEVAPYTSGIITVEVPYSELTGIISDEFFPAETDGSTGTVFAERLRDANIDGFTQIADVSLSEDGEQIFLHCQGLVRNVCLDYGECDEDGAVFNKTATVFATYVLSPGDGIAITADLPDTMPNLRLSYDSGSEHVVRFLSQSGKDGSIFLLNDES